MKQEVERMKKILDLTEKNCIRKGKNDPKFSQYQRRCGPGRNAEETLLYDFLKLIPPGEEWAKAEDQPYKNAESALDSIGKGKEPWKDKKFGFEFRGELKSPDGLFKWDIIASNSGDKTPTLQLLLDYFRPKTITIWYGDI